MKLLFVTPTPPDRPDRDGMTQVANSLIAELGARHQIDVWTLSLESTTPTIPGAHQVRVFPVETMSALRYYLSGSPLPYFQARHQSSKLHQALRSLSADAYDLVILHSPFVAHYLSDIQGRVVVHIMDAMSDWFTKTAQATSFIKRLHLLAEAKKARRVERSLGQARTVTTVSQTDAATVRKFIPNTSVISIPIGINPDLTKPSSQPRLPATIVMTGIMDYPPNIDAGQFFVHHIWPSIRQQHPNAEFRVVGKRPSPAVQALGAVPGVTVTGEVPSLIDELKKATLAVSPLRFGTGYKIKINEALACGTPLVASPTSLSGIDIVPGQTCLTANSPSEWVKSINELLTKPSLRQALSQSATAWAKQHTWDTVAKHYETVYHTACEK